MPTIEDELLGWLVAARWLARQSQSTRAALAFAEYESLSLRLSAGAHRDVLGLAADLALSAQQGINAFASPRKRGAAIASMDTSMVVRAGRLTQLAANAAGAMVKGKIASFGKSHDERNALRAEQYRAVAAIFAEGFGRLKGPAMKIGQLAGYFELGMSAEAQAEFSELLHDSPAMEPEVIRRTVEAELGGPLTRFFDEWSDVPLAAASVAQVHRARLRDGRAVAVKVQYPGIEASISADSRALRLFAPIIKRFFPHSDPKSLLNYIEKRLLAECDFIAEAAHQVAFGRRYADDARVFVPQVVSELSTRRVLTMDFIDGLDFKRFHESATQEERNRAGEIIFSVLFESIFGGGLLHADPHPGNYLFVDGRVCLLDFGAVDEASGPSVEAWRTLVRQLLGIERGGYDFRLLGFDVSDAGFDNDRQLNLLRETFARPWREDQPFRFTREFLLEETRLGALENDALRASTLPTSHLAVTRAILGNHSILGALSAESNWHRILMRIAAPEGSTATTVDLGISDIAK